MQDGGWAERLEIFFGAASATMCRVYARLEFPEPDTRLTGMITGPACPYAQTLPATSRFVDRGPGASLLAEAVLPEPCFWTPELPHVYRIQLELRSADKVLAQVERTFGIRPLGASGRKLFYAGKGWVLRGVSADESAVELADWRAADTAMLVRHPDDALCEAASRVGVLVVAEIETADMREIRRLARWPAVGFISLSSRPVSALRGIGHNLILTQHFAPGEPIAPAPWANAVLCELDQTEPLPRGFADCSLPLLAKRAAGKLESVDAGRRECDRLQRDLAATGQFAGYIV